MKKWQIIWESFRGIWGEDRRRMAWLPIMVGFLGGLLFSFSLVCLNGRIIPGVRVAGIAIGGLKHEAAQTLLTQRLGAVLPRKVTLNYQKRTFDVILGTIGIQPDSEQTIRYAYMLGRTGSLWHRLVTVIRTWHRGIDLPVRFAHNRMVLGAFYRLLDASIGREPVRAIVRVGSDGRVTYTPSVTGRLINRRRLTQLFETAAIKPDFTSIEIPVDKISPTLTSADIKRWSLDQVLGSYLTTFNLAASGRSHNLKIATEALNNVIVYPGQNFSFNTWVGPRMANTGYKEAPVVFNGKLVPGIGGGVCQVSTTLYNAVLFANLPIVKRHNHSLPSAYVPLGRDATVVDGGIDFIFKNNLATPILLTAEVTAPYVRVAILGEKKGWERVDLETEIVEQSSFGKREVSDPQLRQGEVLTQPGKPGYKIKLWRTVHYRNGTRQKTLVNTSIYPAQPEELRVGTKVP